ncbi:MAG: Uma2 family endonuclease [Candidatus Rokubacteria bacterium]|nr:Uma2 family endonuclease [Candidatus Rokubacteria bacterium]
MKQAPLTVRRWKRVEYDRLVDLGMFQDEPLELIAGHLIVAEPQGSWHAATIEIVAEALRGVLPPGWVVRDEKPLALDDDSSPEPDVAVVPGRHADYLAAHPDRPALAIEIAETSLHFDREHKGSLYARARIVDYWIVNLVDDVLEVYREPVTDPLAPYGWRYRSMTRLVPPADLALLALPAAHVAVADLLPSR